MKSPSAHFFSNNFNLSATLGCERLISFLSSPSKSLDAISKWNVLPQLLAHASSSWKRKGIDDEDRSRKSTDREAQFSSTNCNSLHHDVRVGSVQPLNYRSKAVFGVLAGITDFVANIHNHAPFFRRVFFIRCFFFIGGGKKKEKQRSISP